MEMGLANTMSNTIYTQQRLTTSIKLTSENYSTWIKEFNRLATEYPYGVLLTNNHKIQDKDEIINLDNRLYSVVYENCGEFCHVLLETVEDTSTPYQSGTTALKALAEHFTITNNTVLGLSLAKLSLDGYPCLQCLCTIAVFTVDWTHQQLTRYPMFVWASIVCPDKQ
jgi:hypothetical protein